MSVIEEPATVAFRERSRGIEHLKAEILRLEREAGNLVRYLAEGGEST